MRRNKRRSRRGPSKKNKPKPKPKIVRKVITTKSGRKIVIKKKVYPKKKKKTHIKINGVKRRLSLESERRFTLTSADKLVPFPHEKKAALAAKKAARKAKKNGKKGKKGKKGKGKKGKKGKGKRGKKGKGKKGENKDEKKRFKLDSAKNPKEAKRMKNGGVPTMTNIQQIHFKKNPLEIQSLKNKI